MKIRNITLVGAIVGLFIAAPVQAEQQQMKPISKAELWATTCFQCHGAEGQSAGGAIPPLAGYPADIMAQQLKAIKAGTRPSTIMKRHLMGYSDADIDAIATYLGSLKP
ncbi:c-type cytochrome [Thiomicrorhabdus marina]|nr:c-type cytochrome [Thiomicrorhabdus marina]